MSSKKNKDATKKDATKKGTEIPEKFNVLTTESSGKTKVLKKVNKRKSLPVNDPNFLKNIETEARRQSYESFKNVLVRKLEEEKQKKIVIEAQREVNLIAGNNPLSKYGNTKEFRKAKCEFYYETIYQIIDLRMKLFEKIKAKYGENAASAFMFSLRESMSDIWYNDGGNSIELEYAENSLSSKESELKGITFRKESELRNIPMVGYSSVIGMEYEDEVKIEEREEREDIKNNIDSIKNIPPNLIDLPDLESASKVKPIRKDFNSCSEEHLDAVLLNGQIANILSVGEAEAIADKKGNFLNLK